MQKNQNLCVCTSENHNVKKSGNVNSGYAIWAYDVAGFFSKGDTFPRKGILSKSA